MIDALLLIGPVVILLALVFYRLVGCSFHPVSASLIVAHWQLNEPATTVPGETAADTQGPHEGTYVALAGAPQPDPQSDFPTQPLDGVPPGGFRCGEESLVQGSGKSSVRFNGGYVRVFDPDPTIQDRLNPTGDFSVTAWVLPESPVSPGDQSFRSVLTLRADDTSSKGFMIYMGPNLANPADPAYYWQAWVGVGDVNWQNRLIGPVVDFGGSGNMPVTFLAVTYKASTQTLALYVNPLDDGNPAGTLTPTTALVPSSGAPLYIGAGKTNVPDDPQPAPGPQYFFRGLIQEVKIWKITLEGGPSQSDSSGNLPEGQVLTEFALGAFGGA